MKNPNDPTVGSALYCLIAGPLLMLSPLAHWIFLPFALAGILITLGGLVSLPIALKRDWEEV